MPRSAPSQTTSPRSKSEPAAGPRSPRRAGGAFSRVILIVLDSVGIGALPDAASYGDEGSNTLGHVAGQVALRVPTLRGLGLDRLVDLGGPVQPSPRAAYGRMGEASAGKDSVTGHWEMMGIVLDRPFPTFPNGFPREMMTEFERRIGRGTLGNVAASGTEIIERLGAEHMRTGKPIVYTSADSVFQIAAHESVIPIAELYRICGIAFDLAALGAGIGRVIARPFVGAPGSFVRTARRHDYALQPSGPTLLDALAGQGIDVVSIGKVGDLFGGRGISRAVSTTDDGDAMAKVAVALGETSGGLIFANLVDFDTVYGHRNDVAGYAANLERFDERLAAVLPSLRPDDLLVITADHGNDPSTPSTDHSREYVPVLLSGSRVRPADIGTRNTFADLGQTLAESFAVGPLAHGTSFLRDILEEDVAQHS